MLCICLIIRRYYCVVYVLIVMINICIICIVVVGVLILICMNVRTCLLFFQGLAPGMDVGWILQLLFFKISHILGHKASFFITNHRFDRMGPGFDLFNQ